MIDIKFLNVLPEIRLRSGMEFMDWQDKSFYTELSKLFSSCVKKDYTLAMDKDERKELEDIIKKHSNISVTTILSPYGNAAIDAGYINPWSILNINNLDYFLSPSETKTGELMKKTGTNILKGWCNLKTGKVEGDFKNIQFNLYLATSLPKQCMDNEKRFPKGVTLGNVLASIVLHEVGHAFFGLQHLSSSVLDNTIGMAIVKDLVGQKDKNRKAVIVKKVKDIAEVDLSKALEIDDLTPESVLVIFSEGVIRRDSVRALSLGVKDMTFEVLADAYSIRMGGSHGLTSFLASKPSYRPAFVIAAIGVAMLFFPPLILVGGIMIYLGVCFTFGILNMSLTSGTYDSPYRRVKNILRENITFINSNPKGYTPMQLAKAKADAAALEKIVESTKSVWESTWLQRFMGYLSDGKQFRKNDFEHYTAELASSRLALHTTLSQTN